MILSKLPSEQLTIYENLADILPKLSSEQLRIHTMCPWNWQVRIRNCYRGSTLTTFKITYMFNDSLKNN